MNQNKRVIWDWDYLQQFSTGEGLYALTEQNIQSLLTANAVSDWINTRWVNKPSDESLVVDYNADLNIRLMTMIQICEEVADCIENNQTVINVLNQFFENKVLPDNSSENKIGSGDGNVFEAQGCDLDTVYGACVAVEEYIHEIAIDFLEIIENEPNLPAIVLRIIDFVPVLGDLPVADDLNDLVEWILGEGLSSYNAGYTTALQESNECGLFALACADCELSPFEIANFYGSLGGLSFSPDDLFVTIMRLFFDITGNEAFVYGMHAFIASALAAGGEVSKLVGLRGLQTIVATGTPNGGWEALCDPCGNWESIIDYKMDEYSTITFVTWGQYSSGGGWKSQNVPSLGAKQVRLQVDFGAAFVTNVEVTINLDVLGDVSGTILDYLLSARLDTTPESEVSGKWTSSGVYTYSVTPDENIDNVVVFARPNDKDAAGAGLAFIERIKITGTGVKPSVLP